MTTTPNMTLEPGHVTSLSILYCTLAGPVICMALMAAGLIGYVLFRVLHKKMGDKRNTLAKLATISINTTFASSFAVLGCFFFGWIAPVYAWAEATSPITGNVVTGKTANEAISRVYGLTYSKDSHAYIDRQGQIWRHCKTSFNQREDGLVQISSTLTCRDSKWDKRTFKPIR